MRIVTWNVNSIRARHDRLVAWLGKHQPDVLCLQELKIEASGLEALQLEQHGYRLVANCQRTYNGVAILAKAPLEDVAIGLGDGEDDPQARFVAATVRGIRILCVYVPNGGEVGSDKFDYKLRWLERLRAYLDAHCDPKAPLAICGDFNVAPEARDVFDPSLMGGDTLFHPASRAALSRVMEWGLVDAFRIHEDAPGLYSWWDYRMLGFPKNRGLRIDLVLATRSLADRVKGGFIDREERKGKQPSDHAPVVIQIE